MVPGVGTLIFDFKCRVLSFVLTALMLLLLLGE